MYQQRIVIVGAGIVGLSTAYALLKQGVKHVTVLEQAVVDHQRASSHGLSRLLRFEYGPDLFYSQLVRLSLNYWRTIERASKRTLCTPTGLLVLGNENDNFTQPSYRISRELGLPTRRLSQQHCQQFFPQFATHDYDMYTYNTEAGILHASTCLHTLKELILDLGGNIYEVQQVTQITHDNHQRPIRLLLGSGNECIADRVVLAVGPWIHRLLDNLDLPVLLTRQYLLYFAHLSTTTFGLHTFPAFMESELYGFPIHSTYAEHGPSWLKVASHRFGVSVDPEQALPIDERLIAQTVRKVYDLLPAVQHAKLAHIDSYIYDVSPDEDFILDALPDDPRVVFATGLSGHGFKFGLVLGEMLSSLVQDTEPPAPMERFQLVRFSRSYQSQEHTSVA